jgi:hypothetical protein
MYHWACQQMQQDIENTQENLDELNRDASVDNPMIVRDYLAASDEEKSLFEVSRVVGPGYSLPADHPLPNHSGNAAKPQDQCPLDCQGEVV